ncbi:MAG: class I SAM-dependent methyltransferase, partial [Jatrophihabitans sp.]
MLSGGVAVVVDSFDDRAATWDDPDKTARARAVADAITRAVPLDGSERLLEYGAGTGLVAGFLAGSVAAITLADPSAGMREVARGKVESGVLPATTRVWDLNLDLSAPPAEVFDLIVTVMALHHVAGLPAVLSGFAAMLADGGHLCIVDLEEEDGSFHDDPGVAVHSGFGESSLV